MDFNENILKDDDGSNAHFGSIHFFLAQLEAKGDGFFFPNSSDYELFRESSCSFYSLAFRLIQLPRHRARGQISSLQ